MMVKKSCFLIVAAWMVSGCAVNEVITAELNHLDVAEVAPPEEMLLDIGIVEFDDGVPEDNDPVETGVYQEVRSAEVRYLPYHLKQRCKALATGVPCASFHHVALSQMSSSAV